MIYEMKTHSLHCEADKNIKIFSLTIQTLELLFEKKTGKLINARGFFPLIKAVKCKIDLPFIEESEYFLSDVILRKVHENDVWELIDIIPQCKAYFEDLTIKFDSNNGIILLGNEENIDPKRIRINDNLYIGCDKWSNLKCIYIKPTEFI